MLSGAIRRCFSDFTGDDWQLLIDRESTHDTLKNIMTIPVSMPKMLGAKLFWVGIFAVLLGIYSVGVTLITGLTVGLSGLTVEVFFMEVHRSCWQL